MRGRRRSQVCGRLQGLGRPKCTVCVHNDDVRMLVSSREQCMAASTLPQTVQPAARMDGPFTTSQDSSLSSTIRHPMCLVPRSVDHYFHPRGQCRLSIAFASFIIGFVFPKYKMTGNPPQKHREVSFKRLQRPLCSLITCFNN